MPQIAEIESTLKEEEHSTSTVPQGLHHSKFSQGLHCQKWRAYKAGGHVLSKSTGAMQETNGPLSANQGAVA